MQDALLHLQTTVPNSLVDTFMVNGILIAAGRLEQPQLAVMHQCLEVLQELGLPWNETTWRHVFQLQVHKGPSNSCMWIHADASQLQFCLRLQPLAYQLAMPGAVPETAALPSTVTPLAGAHELLICTHNLPSMNWHP